MTIGQTNTNSEEAVTKLNAAINKLPDCAQPNAAVWYERNIAELASGINEKVLKIKRYLEDIKELNKRIERLL